jgi:Amidohydrolase family
MPAQSPKRRPQSPKPRAQSLTAVAAVLVAWAFVSGQGSQPVFEPVLVKGARVLDVEAGRYQAVSAVLIANGRIAAVHLAEPTSVPRQARQLDLTGMTLVPGLGDVHARAYPDASVDADYFYALGLAYGVTLYRTLDVPLPWGVSQRERVQSGEVLAPRLWTSGPGIDELPAFRLSLRQVGDAATARLVVQEQARGKVDWINVHAGTGAELYQAIIAEAKAGKVKVAGESGVVSVAALSQIGVDSIEGLGFPARSRAEYEEPLRTRPDFPRDDPAGQLAFVWERMPAADLTGTITQLVRGRTVLVPLLAGGRGFARLADLAGDPALAYLPAPRREKVLAEVGVPEQPAKTSAESARRYRAWLIQARFIRDLVAAKGIVATGTDFDGTGYPVPGAGIHKELQLLVRAGLTPAEAIRAATVNTATLVGASSWLGQIKTGFGADLFAVEGDPLTQIGDLQRVRIVIRGGEVLDPKELLAQASRAVR